MFQDENEQVERALLRRALGYDYKELRTEETDKGSKSVEVTKHLPPDIRAAVFWLKNRMPERWSDKQLLEHEGSFEIEEPDGAYEGLSMEELMRKAYGDG